MDIFLSKLFTLITSWIKILYLLCILSHPPYSPMRQSKKTALSASPPQKDTVTRQGKQKEIWRVRFVVHVHSPVLLLFAPPLPPPPAQNLCLLLPVRGFSDFLLPTRANLLRFRFRFPPPIYCQGGWIFQHKNEVFHCRERIVGGVCSARLNRIKL